MAIDLKTVRNDTPACESIIHFNNAGASLMPRQVLEAVVSHLELEAAIGGYEAADLAQDAIHELYRSIARLVNGDPDEIAVLENATRAWDMAFYSIPFQPGDRILTSMTEYGSNFVAFLQVSRRTGAVVDVIPNDEHGRISAPALRNAMDDRVKLIALTHVPTNGGLIQPAEAVGGVAREANVLYLLDACQSVGQMPLDVKKIGCHMLSGTGRKFLRGPRGTGFLYVDRNVMERLDPVFLDIHSARWLGPDRYEIMPDARRFENWESNIAAKLGLGAAIDYALRLGLDDIRERVTFLAARLRSRLESLPGVTLHDLGCEKCGIVTFTSQVAEPAAIRQALRGRSINVAVSPADFSRLDMGQRGLTALVRASVHYYNTEEEVERFIEAL